MPFGTEVDEQYLLDLERQAFLSLIVGAKIPAAHAAYACERETVKKLIIQGSIEPSIRKID